MIITEIIDKIRGRVSIAESIPTVIDRPPEYADAIGRITNLCVRVGLEKMLRGGHFSICDLDVLCQAAGVRVDGDVRRALSCIHCVKWEDMPKELRSEVYRILAATFTEKTP